MGNPTKLLQVLGAKDNDGLFDGCAPSVKYALRRLVRGLGSSREVRHFRIHSSGIFRIILDFIN